MKNKGQLQEYFNSKYYNQKKNYKKILSKIQKKDVSLKEKMLRIVATICIAIFGTTGLVFATNKIYNDYKSYIKSKDSLKLDVYTKVDESGAHYIEDGMNFDKESGCYYEIITDTEEYNKFKVNRKSEFPEMTDDDFNKSALIFVVEGGYLQQHERDLFIKDIKSDDETTYIIIRQNENPDNSFENRMQYAIVDKSILREKIEIKFEHNKVKSDFVALEDLQSDYSIEDALKDGCFVIEEMGYSTDLSKPAEVLSSNKYAIDEFLESAKAGKDAFIRVYCANELDDSVIVRDLCFIDGVFILDSLDLDSMNIYTESAPYCVKIYDDKLDWYMYWLSEYENKQTWGNPSMCVLRGIKGIRLD